MKHAFETPVEGDREAIEQALSRVEDQPPRPSPRPQGAANPPSPVVCMAAGMIATLPMTVLMELLFRRLPESERFPLPPKRVAMRIAEKAHFNDRLSESEHFWFALASHLGFGAVSGLLYSLIGPKIEAPVLVRGPLVGAAIWVVNYFGWLPATGLINHAAKQPTGQNTVMLSAHLLWGACTAAIVEAAA